MCGQWRRRSRGMAGPGGESRRWPALQLSQLATVVQCSVHCLRGSSVERHAAGQSGERMYTQWCVDNTLRRGSIDCHSGCTLGTEQQHDLAAPDGNNALPLPPCVACACVRTDRWCTRPYDAPQSSSLRTSAGAPTELSSKTGSARALSHQEPRGHPSRARLASPDLAAPLSGRTIATPDAPHARHDPNVASEHRRGLEQQAGPEGPAAARIVADSQRSKWER